MLVTEPLLAERQGLLKLIALKQQSSVIINRTLYYTTISYWSQWPNRISVNVSREPWKVKTLDETLPI